MEKISKSEWLRYSAQAGENKAFGECLGELMAARAEVRSLSAKLEAAGIVDWHTDPQRCFVDRAAALRREAK